MRPSPAEKRAAVHAEVIGELLAVERDQSCRRPRGSRLHREVGEQAAADRFGAVWKMRRESARFFCALTNRRLRMSCAWQAQAPACQGASRGAARCKKRRQVSSAATTFTISGSSGTQAYVSAKTCPGPRCSKCSCCPMRRRSRCARCPRRTSPIDSVRSPARHGASRPRHCRRRL